MSMSVLKEERLSEPVQIWHETQSAPHGMRVVLRLVDGGDNISYGLGWLDPDGQWVFTARENEKTATVVGWAFIPD
jgi:hypothetical protein